MRQIHDQPQPNIQSSPNIDWLDAANDSLYSSAHVSPPQRRAQTLQMRRSNTNHKRVLYMERNSLLNKKDLTVKVEQVSIFLTDDNSVICFFENSADDIEHPILKRLSSPDTILRRSCDASLLVQAIMDAIIDLAVPIVSAYEEVIDDLEVEVLEDPALGAAAATYPARSPRRAIDAVLARGHLRVLGKDDDAVAAAGVRPTDLLTATDHLPVVVDLQRTH